MIGRGSRWLAKQASKQFKDPKFVESFEETLNKVDLKKSAVQVGLAGTIGGAIALNEDAIDFDNEEVMGSVGTIAKAGALLGAAAVGTIGLTRATRLLKPNVSSTPWKHFKKTMTGNPGSNTLEKGVALIDNNFQPKLVLY